MRTIKNTILILFVVGCQTINNNVNNNDSTPTTQLQTITESCLQEGDDALKNVSLPGNLVVYKNEKYGLLYMDQNTFIGLPESMKISPDGQKAAQFDNTKNGIIVSNMEGDLLMFFPKDDQWMEANLILYGSVLDYDPNYIWFDWWDNNFLFIRSLPIGSQLMLNVETGEIHEIEFPYSEEVWTFGGFADIRDYYVSFAPDFDKVVYASTMSHLVLRNNSVYGDGKWRTITWVGYSFTYSNPRWSPDGGKLIFVKQSKLNVEDLYGIDATATLGERNLTNLESFYNHPYRASITLFDWSPDGNKIVFVAGVTPKEGDETLNRLLVLDLASGTIEDYCNPDPNNPYSSQSFGFSWSPDGKYIATDTTIVDLGLRRVYKIPDVYIVDWVGEGRNR